MASGKGKNIENRLAHADLVPSVADTKQLEAIWHGFRERLRLLHEANLEDEEVAGFFTPDSGQGEKSQGAYKPSQR